MPAGRHSFSRWGLYLRGLAPYERSWEDSAWRTNALTWIPWQLCSFKPRYEYSRDKRKAQSLTYLSQRICQAKVTVLGLSVCQSVTTFSATTCNKPAKKRHQRVQHYTGFILNMAIVVKVLRSKVMAWKPSQQANMLVTAAPYPWWSCHKPSLSHGSYRLLCVSWKHKKSQRRACIDSCMLSTTVASPCPTLRELLAGDHG